MVFAKELSSREGSLNPTAFPEPLAIPIHYFPFRFFPAGSDMTFALLKVDNDAPFRTLSDLNCQKDLTAAESAPDCRSKLATSNGDEL